MIAVLRDGIENASSVHRFGRLQNARVDVARQQVAALVGGRPATTIFTAGATEANNLALQGIALGAEPKRHRILISAVEHASVSETAKALHNRRIVQCEVIPVTPSGCVDVHALHTMIGFDVILVSVTAANSETGALNPIRKIAEIAHRAGALLHCDATQFAGRLPFDMMRESADLIALSGHKMCGPAGVGALIGNRPSLRRLKPMVFGGGHERGLRSGSLNVAGIVGLGAAAAIATEERRAESTRVSKLRDRLTSTIKSRVRGAIELGSMASRLPNTASIRFEGADGKAVATNMDPVAVSVGSACNSGSIEPSSVAS